MPVHSSLSKMLGRTLNLNYVGYKQMQNSYCKGLSTQPCVFLSRFAKNKVGLQKSDKTLWDPAKFLPDHKYGSAHKPLVGRYMF